MRRQRTTRSFTAGERTLPGGRAALLVAIALVVSCAAPAATVTAPAATPAPLASRADASAAIPTLGTTPPRGLVLPSYFVTVTSSSDGALAVLTTPASRCSLNVRRPSGATIEAGERVADANGIGSWSYPPLSEHGELILTVRCVLGDQVGSAEARVLLP